jgi:membrane fusion protein (multidrug efflux system)
VLADLMLSHASLGIYPESYEVTPGKLMEEMYNQNPERNLHRTFETLLKNAPAVKQAEAKLLKAERDLEQSRLSLRYCRVFAEIDGVITRRNVNQGNNVQAGQALMGVRSLTEIWIDANFKETQLADLRIGQRVEVAVDMYGGRHQFEGRISGFTMGTGSTFALLPPQNATGNFVKVVQRLPVRIELDHYDHELAPLFVGLSVTPRVYIAEPPTGPNAGRFLQPGVSGPRSDPELYTATADQPSSVPTDNDP